MKNILAILAITACLLFVGCKKEGEGTTPNEPDKKEATSNEKTPGDKGGEPTKPGGKSAAGTQPAGINPNLSKDQIENRAGTQSK